MDEEYDVSAPFYVITCKKCGYSGWSTRRSTTCIRYANEVVRITGIKGTCDGEVICETPTERTRRLKNEAAKEIIDTEDGESEKNNNRSMGKRTQYSSLLSQQEAQRLSDKKSEKTA